MKNSTALALAGWGLSVILFLYSAQGFYVLQGAQSILSHLFAVLAFMDFIAGSVFWALRWINSLI